MRSFMRINLEIGNTSRAHLQPIDCHEADAENGPKGQQGILKRLSSKSADSIITTNSPERKMNKESAAGIPRHSRGRSLSLPDESSLEIHGKARRSSLLSPDRLEAGHNTPANVSSRGGCNNDAEQDKQGMLCQLDVKDRDTPESEVSMKEKDGAPARRRNSVKYRPPISKLRLAQNDIQSEGKSRIARRESLEMVSQVLTQDLLSRMTPSDLDPSNLGITGSGSVAMASMLPSQHKTVQGRLVPHNESSQTPYLKQSESSGRVRRKSSLSSEETVAGRSLSPEPRRIIHRKTPVESGGGRRFHRNSIPSSGFERRTASSHSQFGRVRSVNRESSDYAEIENVDPRIHSGSRLRLGAEIHTQDHCSGGLLSETERGSVWMRSNIESKALSLAGDLHEMSGPTFPGKQLLLPVLGPATSNSSQAETHKSDVENQRKGCISKEHTIGPEAALAMLLQMTEESSNTLPEKTVAGIDADHRACDEGQDLWNANRTQSMSSNSTSDASDTFMRRPASISPSRSSGRSSPQKQNGKQVSPDCHKRMRTASLRRKTRPESDLESDYNPTTMGFTRRSSIASGMISRHLARQEKETPGSSDFLRSKSTEAFSPVPEEPPKTKSWKTKWSRAKAKMNAIAQFEAVRQKIASTQETIDDTSKKLKEAAECIRNARGLPSPSSEGPKEEESEEEVLLNEDEESQRIRKWASRWRRRSSASKDVRSSSSASLRSQFEMDTTKEHAQFHCETEDAVLEPLSPPSQRMVPGKGMSWVATRRGSLVSVLCLVSESPDCPPLGLMPKMNESKEPSEEASIEDVDNRLSMDSQEQRDPALANGTVVGLQCASLDPECSVWTGPDQDCTDTPQKQSNAQPMKQRVNGWKLVKGHLPKQSRDFPADISKHKHCADFISEKDQKLISARDDTCLQHEEAESGNQGACSDSRKGEEESMAEETTTKIRTFSTKVRLLIKHMKHMKGEGSK